MDLKKIINSHRELEEKHYQARSKGDKSIITEIKEYYHGMVADMIKHHKRPLKADEKKEIWNYVSNRIKNESDKSKEKYISISNLHRKLISKHTLAIKGINHFNYEFNNEEEMMHKVKAKYHENMCLMTLKLKRELTDVEKKKVWKNTLIKVRMKTQEAVLKGHKGYYPESLYDD